jgi:hypothetical protein
MSSPRCGVADPPPTRCRRISARSLTLSRRRHLISERHRPGVEHRRARRRPPVEVPHAPGLHGERCPPRVNARDHPSAREDATGAPLARQRGGRRRSRDTPAEGSRARTRRRSCGREGVDARGPRNRRKRPARQRRCSGGWRRTRPQTEPAESEERDPPTGPARRRLPAARRRAYETFAGLVGAPLDSAAPDLALPFFLAPLPRGRGLTISGRSRSSLARRGSTRGERHSRLPRSS